MKLFIIYKQDYLDKENRWIEHFNNHFSNLNEFLPIDGISRERTKKRIHCKYTSRSLQIFGCRANSSVFSILEIRIRIFYDYFFNGNVGEIQDRISFGKLSCNLLNKLHLNNEEVCKRCCKMDFIYA